MTQTKNNQSKPVKKLTYKDFPVGKRVRVNTKFQDFQFFNMEETGTVVKNSERYLGIIVKFDDKFPRPNWNFEPENLMPLKKALTEVDAL